MSYNTEKDYNYKGWYTIFSLREKMSQVIEKGPVLGPNEFLNNLLVIVKESVFSFDLQQFRNFILFDLLTSDGYMFVWHSTSTESTCPRCGTISTNQRHTYKKRVVIDEEILGKPVIHVMRLKQFICDRCKAYEEEKTSFVEDITMICRPYLKTTIGLDEKLVNDGRSRSAEGLAEDYKGRIDVSSETILRRVKEAGAMVTEKRLTETEGVKALSVDDNNSRKGNPTTACTVVIDAETHDVLVVAEGATSEVAKKIFDKFTDATHLSRDRACSYSKAGDECSLEQVADIFHLVQNAHDAVKKGLSKELRRNIYIREGDGWVELSVSAGVSGSENQAPVSTLTEEDITNRVRLARLTARQEKKYRKVIELLKLYDEGLSDSEISKRLGISWAEARKLLSEAGDVINKTESKIDEYLIDSGNNKFLQKLISKNAEPSEKSIVEPYSEIVMSMVSEGHSHRKIYPVIKEMGYKGSANAIYQYIVKKRNEEAAEKAGDSSAAQNAAPGSISHRPKRISMQRIAQGNIYKYILHQAADGRGTTEDKVAHTDVNPTGELSETEAIPEPEIPVASETGTPTDAPIHKSSIFYSDEVADIIHRQIVQDDEKSKKKPELPDFKKIESLNPIVGRSIVFLQDFHKFIDDAIVSGLTEFIDNYKTCGVDSFESYARGLEKDFSAVKNAILNRNISNGPIEGVNNKIKLFRKTRYGRAKIELINAVAVLSSIDNFSYKDYNVVKTRYSTKLCSVA